MDMCWCSAADTQKGKGLRKKKLNEIRKKQKTNKTN